MSNLDPLCNGNLKANTLQQSRDKEPKKKCTMIKGIIGVGGNCVDDDLFDIELLS